MSDPWFLLGVIVMGLALGAIGAEIGTRIQKRRHRSVDPFSDQARPKTSEATLYCRDCGKNLVSVRSQDGFDPKTGEPRYTYDRGCPDYDKYTAKRMTHYNRMASLGFPYTLTSTWPDCGERTTQSKVTGAHNHPDPETVTTTCPVCIDLLVNNGVIPMDEAKKLYLAAS